MNQDIWLVGIEDHHLTTSEDEFYIRYLPICVCISLEGTGKQI